VRGITCPIIGSDVFLNPSTIYTVKLKFNEEE
jgi:hypothetical protein